MTSLTQEEIEEKAKELADSIKSQIATAQKALMREMVALGMSHEDYYLVDNLKEVIEDPTIPYLIQPRLKLNKRGNY